MKKFRRFCAMALAMGMVVSAVTGCSKEEAATTSGKTEGATSTSKTSTSETSTSDKTEEPLEISIFFPGTADVDRNNVIVKDIIEEATNTQLTFVEAAAGEWQQKLSIMLSSGAETDIITSYGDASSVMNRYAAEGFFHEADKLLGNMPNAQEYITDDLIDKLKAGDGNLYVFPTIRDIGCGAFFVREDWLENLGLEEPTTIDEYYEVLKAFTFDDPNGSGQNDTYGLITDDKGNFQLFAGIYGLPVAEWMIDGDELIYSSVHPDMKEALAFAAKVYEEGLMHPESITMKSASVEEKIAAGQIGVFHSVSSGASRMTQAMRDVDPNAVTKVLPVPTAPGVEEGYGSVARVVRNVDNKPMQLSSIMAISSNVKESELDRYAEFLDWFFTPEGNAAQTYGIEGETYTVSGDQYDLLPDATLDGLRQVGAWDQIHIVGYIPQRDHFVQLWDQQTSDNMINTAASAWPKQIYFSTPTGDRIAADIENKRIEIFQQVVAGTMSVDEGWDKWISEFNRLGGEEWTKEMNEEYSNRK